MSDKTKFFYEVTPDRILAAVEELDLRCTGKILPLNSLENRVYDVEIDVDYDQIETRYEASRVIKFYRPGRWTKEQILEEHEFISDLAKQDIPVVEPLQFSDRETLHSIKEFDSDGSELFYAIFPKVGGRILDEYSDNQIEQLGRLIARMHQVARAKSAEHRIQINPETFARVNCQYLVESKTLPPEIEERYVQLVNTICDTAEPWFEGVPYQRVHGDCHLGNILWDHEACRLVDFDDFAMGPAVQDLWLIIAGRESWNLKQRDLLIDSYSQFTDFDYETIRLIEPLRAMRLVHFSSWIAKRWEDPAFQNIFSDFASPQYWRQQLISLEEVLQIMQCGEVF